MLGESAGVVEFEDAGFLFLEGCAVSAVAAERAEVGTAPERSHDAIHALDQFGEGRLSRAFEIDDIDRFGGVGDDREFFHERFEGIFHLREFGSAARGAGDGTDAGESELFRKIEPGLERIMFEEKRARTGEHECVTGGDEPIAFGHGLSVQSAGSGEEAERSGGGFEIPERDEAEGGRDKHCRLTIFDFRLGKRRGRGCR